MGWRGVFTPGCYRQVIGCLQSGTNEFVRSVGPQAWKAIVMGCLHITTKQCLSYGLFTSASSDASRGVLCPVEVLGLKKSAEDKSYNLMYIHLRLRTYSAHMEFFAQFKLLV